MKRLTILMIVVFFALSATGCRRCGWRGGRCRLFAPRGAYPTYPAPPTPHTHYHPQCCPPQCCNETPCFETGCGPSGVPYSTSGSFDTGAGIQGESWTPTQAAGSGARFQPPSAPGEFFSHVVGDRILSNGADLPGATATPEPPKAD